MSAYRVPKVSLCLRGRPRLWSPSSSVSGFLLLFFPSALSLLVSHHYSFSESLLSLLKHASQRASREALGVCNLGWLTHCKKPPCVCAAAAALIPARRLVPSEAAGDCAVQGLIVWLCARACLRYLIAICRNTASCLRGWLDCQSHFGPTLAKTNTQHSNKRRRSAAATWCAVVPSKTWKDPYNPTPQGQVIAEICSFHTVSFHKISTLIIFRRLCNQTV